MGRIEERSVSDIATGIATGGQSLKGVIAHEIKRAGVTIAIGQAGARASTRVRGLTRAVVKMRADSRT